MGSEWKNIPLGDLISLQRGHDLPSQDRADGAVPIMGSSGLTGYHDKAKCQGPGVVVGRSGNSMGVVSFCDEDYWPLNTALYVTDFKGNDPRYIYYLLSLIDFDQFNSGSAQKSLNRNAVYPYEVWATTDKDEQKAIGQLLEDYERKIELNRQINTTLESMAQALFKSWFVDFDPVIDNALAAGNPIPDELSARAERRRQLRESPDKLAGQPVCTPDEDARRASTMDGASDNPHPPLPADIQQLFPSSFVFTEEMGWVPEGWEVSTAGDEFIVRGGSTPSTKKPEFWENGTVHWTTPKDLSGNQTKLLVDTERRITSEGLNTITSGLLPVNTVLMSSRAPVGYLAINKVPVAINQGYIALTCEKTCSPGYAIQWLDSIVDQLKNISGGTTFAEISKKTFKGVRLVVPSKEVVDKYTEIVEGNYDKIFANEKETNSLINIRDSLLPKLLSGEVVVGESCE